MRAKKQIQFNGTIDDHDRCDISDFGKGNIDNLQLEPFTQRNVVWALNLNRWIIHRWENQKIQICKRNQKSLSIFKPVYFISRA